MSRKPSADSEAARIAFEKASKKGIAMTATELAFKFNLSPSSIYRAPWYKNRTAQTQTGEK